MNQRRKQVPFILNSDACESHNTLMFMPQRKAMSLTFFVKKNFKYAFTSYISFCPNTIVCVMELIPYIKFCSVFKIVILK